MSQLMLTDQLVLSIDTRQRLTDYNIFTKDIDEKDFDLIIQLIKFPIPFPKYDFHKIPF